MSKFSGTCSSWQGLSLRKAINLDKRDQVKHNEASLLDFRNYLFSRQCAVLFLVGRPIEVAHRAATFLFHTLHEVDYLNVSKLVPSLRVMLTQLSFISSSPSVSEGELLLSLFVRRPIGCYLLRNY